MSGVGSASTNPIRFAGAAWGAAGVCYVASEAIAAAAFSPAYSYAQNYISDLGVPDCGTLFAGRAICSPLHLVMNGDFVLQGVLFLAAGIAAWRALRSPARWPLVVCAALNGIGIVLVGLFPETSAVNGLHGLGALLSIVFGNMTALVSAFAFRELRLPRVHRAVSLTLPLIAAVALTTLLAARGRDTPLLVPDGIWERISVYTITAWELVTAFTLWKRSTS